MNMERSIALVRACAERLRAAELSVGQQAPALEPTPPVLGTRVLDRKNTSEEGHLFPKGDDQ